MTEETRASVCSPATQLGEHILKYKPIRTHVTTPFVVSLSTSDMLFSALVLPILCIRFVSR